MKINLHQLLLFPFKPFKPFHRCAQFNRFAPSSLGGLTSRFLLPRDAGEDQGGGLNDWNFLNDLNSGLRDPLLISPFVRGRQRGVSTATPSWRPPAGPCHARERNPCCR
jgi:hypothetical protein